MYTYILQTDNSGFEEEGVYTSQIHDLDSVYKWANLEVDYDINDNTNLLIETSSSANSSTWSDWSPVTKGKEVNGIYSYRINSPAQQYIKVRFSMYSGDGIYTPVVRSYSIKYYQDLLAPTNPDISGLEALSASESGTNIVSNNWYNHPNPFFQWAPVGDVLGASDGINGSGVAGYYVYWGTDSNSDPELLGTLSTNPSFTANNLIDATTYYLRIKTIDEAGNVSEETLQPFIYKYDDSGPGILENITADPSGYTAIDNFNFSWDSTVTSGAPMVEYCYKTGATSGPFSIEQCTSETSASDIPSYRV